MPTAVTSIVSVAVVEDRHEIRQGIAYLIRSTEGFRCAHVYSSMEEALERIGDRPPHVALVDLGLPGMSGIQGITHLHHRFPGMALLVLTVYEDDDRIFAALSAGACGYLLKRTPPVRLVECIREAAAGGSPMSPEVARRVIELFRKFTPKEANWPRLTPQEQQLLRLLGEGHQYKTAAAAMGLSIHTVSYHVRHIYEKLHTHSKSETVAKAIREGLI